ncbi:MAG: hypothetical protein DRP47_00230 [Candidatus Zixiibacteriota bacterium]|nr:MAG: hypothetical protein DRP47_00230 [candidate division Zixibacteria bacterium]
MKQFKLLMCFFVVLWILAGTAWSAPRLTIPDADFNFGFVPQHSKISHDFWLLSTGDDELKILKVVPG